MSTQTVPQPMAEVQKFLQASHKLLIDGKRQDAQSGETFEVVDPSNNSGLTQVPKGGKEDIDLAVKAARRAFETGPWRKLTVSERGKLIWKLADLIEQRSEEFAQLETLDNGKPLAIARAASAAAGHALLRAGFLGQVAQGAESLDGFRRKHACASTRPG